jgi:hypothetical protein
MGILFFARSPERERTWDALVNTAPFIGEVAIPMLRKDRRMMDRFTKTPGYKASFPGVPPHPSKEGVKPKNPLLS